MKLNTTSAPVEVSGGADTHSFKIAMNGKAFRVLSDTLYQNKIGSIVREVSCNAYDAHVMAGKKDVPFIIHLPDAFEPWFSVQDFGVGLSPSDITNVFTAYFQSTKDDSNDAVGAFGLGAKTPFSYTDQFTVTSVKDGISRTYSAYITESGVPAIVEMDSSPTDDINGVEIRLSVKREDYNKFASEVASQLKFFTVKPQVVNKNNFQFESVSDNLAVDTANVSISNDRASYGQAWAYVIQGNVGYPLDVAQINEKLSSDNKRLLDTLNGTQVRFYFNIGEIGVTASREGVEYNKHTIANIEKKLDAVRAELTAHIHKELQGKKTNWDKALFLNSSDALNKLAHASGISIPNVKRGSGKYHFEFAELLVDSNKKDQFGRPVSKGSVKRWEHGRNARMPENATVQPSMNNKVFIVLRDTAIKSNIRAKHFLSGLDSKYNLMEIELYDGYDFDDSFIKKLKETLGGFSDIKRLSEIEPPAKVSTAADGTRVRNSYSRPTHYSFDNLAGSNLRKWEREFDALDENDEDTIYVVIKDMDFVSANGANLVSQYQKLSKIDNKVAPLIAIRDTDLKKIKDMTNYQELAVYIEKATNRIKSNKKLFINWRHGIIGQLMYSNISHHLIQESVLEAFKQIAPNTKPTRMLAVAKRLKSKLEADGNKLLLVADFMGWDASNYINKTREAKFSTYRDGMMNRYPLLSAYGDWQVRNKISPEHLAKYVSVM